jgi:ethanolamine permease
MYCFGSLPFVDIARYAPSPDTTGIISETDSYSPQWFIGGISSFMHTLPLAAWFYVGIESLNLCASVVHDPKMTIPIGSISCVCTLFVTSIFVLCVCSSLPSVGDGVATADIVTPLDKGFFLMFKIPRKYAILFNLPAMFATAYGFIFAFSRVMISMARSGLLPPMFQLTYGRFRTPYMTILIGSFTGYLLLILVYFIPLIGQYLFTICILSGFIAYISQVIIMHYISRSFMSF